jgi:Tol biopolymer transport system component
LALAIDRSGSEALYLLPIKEGRAAGDPVFIRYGSFDHGRTSPRGTLVYRSTPPGGNYATGLWTQNSDGHSDGWKQLALSGSNQGYHAPAWSPDGSQIAYVAQNHAARQDVRDVRLRTMSTGEERLLFRGGSEYMQCLWAARHPSLFCVQREAQASKLVSISIESGRAERLRSLPLVTGPLLPDRDDSAVYMVQMQPQSQFPSGVKAISV